MIQSCSIGDWWVVLPDGDRLNSVLNPSAETTDNFVARTTATVTRSTTYQYRGLYSYRVQTGAPDEGIHLTLEALTNAAHYASLQARANLPEIWQWSLDNANWHNPTLLKEDNGWWLYGFLFPASEANASTLLRIRQVSGEFACDWYIDCINVQDATYLTTHIDGDEDGCVWNGAVHGSSSTRSAQSRAGGRVRRINEYYGVNIDVVDGHGMANISHNRLGQGLLPGELLQSVKVQPRTLQINVIPPALPNANLDAPQTNTKKLHRLRKGLVDAFKPDLVKNEKGEKPQAVRLRYTGADKELEINAHYLSGLDGHFDPEKLEVIPLRFMAYEDPMWHEMPHGAVSSLGKLAVTGANGILKKLDGVWSALGTSGTPGISGGVTTIYAIVLAQDGCLYVGGDFASVDGVANTGYIAKYNPYTNAWTSVGGGLSDVVYALALAPDGTLYAGGGFLNAGGDGNADRIAQYNPATDTWSSLSASIPNSIVRALAYAQDGSLYVGGNFTAIGAVANTAYIAKFSAGAWSALGTGMDGGVAAIALAPYRPGQGIRFYAGGNFNTSGGVTTNGIAYWNSGAWYALGTGAAGDVYALTVAPNGWLYLGGNFTSLNAVTCANIGLWNGTNFAPLGSGLSGGSCYGLIFGPTGLLYAGGSFTSAGGLTLGDRVAIWTGTDWIPLDVDLPGSPNVNVIVPLSTSFYVGFDTTGSAIASYPNAAVDNTGSTLAYPIIKLKRTGGTSATVEWIANETTGKILRLYYPLQDGETVTIDLTPGKKKVVSDDPNQPQGGKGEIDVIGRTALKSSDFASWCLLPGENDISVFISDVGSPVVSVSFEWQIRHWSTDGGAN